VMPAVPMWFGLLDPDKADANITQLSGPDFQTDWGMRILSAQNPLYDPGGYHSGTVWPLFTGWAAEADYRYHRPLAGLANLYTNALLTFGGTPGHVTEVLSGNYYQTLATGSPAQVWSSAMVVAPLLKGLLGLDANALAHTLTFAPHVPPGWTEFSVGNVKLGSAIVALKYGKTPGAIHLEISRAGSGDGTLLFSPAVSLRARVLRVLLDGHKVPFQVQPNSNDQHVAVQVPLAKPRQTLVIQLDHDFALAEPSGLPLLGTASRGVRVLSETWNPDHTILRLRIAGVSGAKYSLDVWNPEEIASLEGATLVPGIGEHGSLSVQMAGAASDADTPAYVQTDVAIHFKGATATAREK
jgi:hypothetical protein